MHSRIVCKLTAAKRCFNFVTLLSDVFIVIQVSCTVYEHVSACKQRTVFDCQKTLRLKHFICFTYIYIVTVHFVCSTTLTFHTVQLTQYWSWVIITD